MDGWPISISEAARRLNIPFHVASILVRSLEIPTLPMANFLAKGLDEAGFERLKIASHRFRRTSRPLASAES